MNANNSEVMSHLIEISISKRCLIGHQMITFCLRKCFAGNECVRRYGKYLLLSGD
jgi:hypothetical protein